VPNNANDRALRAPVEYGRFFGWIASLNRHQHQLLLRSKQAQL